jgi:hypothetical protein
MSLLFKKKLHSPYNYNKMPPAFEKREAGSIFRMSVLLFFFPKIVLLPFE